MIARISPLAKKLLRPNEECELVVCGGYGAVREFFILTDVRIIIARQLGERLVAVTFDRERELWMELRANKFGTDFLICSSDTMERVRAISDTDLALLKATFNLEEGDFEDTIPCPDKMYELFRGLPGSRQAEGLMTPAHYSFYIVSTVLFALLAFECGRLIGPLAHGGGTIGWLFVLLAAFITAIFVKSSLQIACFITIGLPALLAGVERAAPNTPWQITQREGLQFAFIAMGIWFVSALLQGLFRRIGGAKPLPPRPAALAITSVIIGSLVFVAMYERQKLSPHTLRRFSRRVYHKMPICKMELMEGTPDQLVLFDNQYVVAASLGGGPTGPWEIWTHTDVPVAEFPINSLFSGGLLFHSTGSKLAAFDLLTGKDEWFYEFPPPSGVLPAKGTGGRKLHLELRVHEEDDVLDVLSWWGRAPGAHRSLAPLTAELAVLSRQTGQRFWRSYFPLSWKGLPPGRPQLVSCPVDNLLVDVPGYQLTCLQRNDGTKTWTHRWEPGSYGPCNSGSTIAFLCGNRLIALSLRNGKVLYQLPLPGKPLWQVFRHISGSFVVAIAEKRQKRLLFIAPENGEIKETIEIPKQLKENLDFKEASNGIVTWKDGYWRFYRGKEKKGYTISLDGASIVGSPISREGRTYLATNGGFIIAVDDSCGKVVWRYRTRGPLTEGGLIVGRRGPIALTQTGILHAFNR